MMDLLANGYSVKAKAAAGRGDMIELGFWSALQCSARTGLCMRCVNSDSSANAGNCANPECSNYGKPPVTKVLNMRDLVRSARQIGAYPPASYNNPLSRELTDSEIEAKILTSAIAVSKAEEKRARKLRTRQVQAALVDGAYL